MRSQVLTPFLKKLDIIAKTFSKGLSLIKIFFIIFLFITTCFASRSYEDNSSALFEDNFDKKSLSEDIKILAHKANYILPITYDSRNHDDRKSAEAQFQISLKLPLYKNLLGSGGDLFSAYTQNSYWQVYDNTKSAPFRETNHQPEIFLEFTQDKKLNETITLTNTQIALIHQSNGKSLPHSRSWNRAQLQMVFDYDNFFDFGFTLWHRFDEQSKPTPESSKGDDNPDLEDFIGRQKYFFELHYKKYDLRISHQNDITHYNFHKGNIKTEFFFPSFNKNFKWYLNHFYGYGESLIDYNVKVNKIGFGLLVSKGKI